MDITLTEQEYLALVALARDALKGETNKTLALEETLKSIESRAGLHRFLLVVRWEDLGLNPPPYSAEFIDSYPAALEGRIERVDRPIAKADVVAYVATKARRAGEIYVTRDPAGRVGWSKLSQFFP